MAMKKSIFIILLGLISLGWGGWIEARTYTVRSGGGGYSGRGGYGGGYGGGYRGGYSGSYYPRSYYGGSYYRAPYYRSPYYYRPYYPYSYYYPRPYVYAGPFVGPVGYYPYYPGYYPGYYGGGANVYYNTPGFSISVGSGY